MPCKNCSVSIRYVPLGLKYCPWCGLELNPRCPDLSNVAPSPFADRICDSLMRNGGMEAVQVVEQPQQLKAEIAAMVDQLEEAFNKRDPESFGYLTLKLRQLSAV